MKPHGIPYRAHVAFNTPEGQQSGSGQALLANPSFRTQGATKKIHLHMRSSRVTYSSRKSAVPHMHSHAHAG